MPDRRFHRQVCSVAVAALLAALSVPAAPQEPVAEPTLRVNATEITVGGRVQTQFNTSSVDTVPETELLLRRVRLEATVKVNDLISGKVQPEFAGERATVADAFLRLHFASWFQVTAGKAHRPFGILTPLSSVRMLPVERGAVIRGISPLEEHNLTRGLGYSDRDVGLQVAGAPEGAPLGFSYALGYFDGPLRARTGADEEDPDQFVGRVSVLPLKPLRIGLSASTREFRGSDSAGATLQQRGTAWAVDAEFGAFEPGLHVLGELAWGDYDPFRGTSFFGAQSWLAYRTGRLGRVVAHLEPMLRVSYGNLGANVPATLARRDGTLLTPGLNVYFDRLNRFMLNYDAWLPGPGASRERSFKAMFQLAF